jgi:hypothetical protein
MKDSAAERPRRREFAAPDVMFTVEIADHADTPEFKRWFGDSKVVDANGQPLVVYHGTTSEEQIWVFESLHDDGAIFFTDSPDQALSYGERIYETYLTISNPLVVDFNGNHYDGLIEGAQDQFTDLTLDREIARAKTLGKDGLIAKDIIARGPEGELYTGTDPADIYVVFNPTQIKAVTNNDGTFNSSRMWFATREGRHDQAG